MVTEESWHTGHDVTNVAEPKWLKATEEGRSQVMHMIDLGMKTQ